MADSKLFPSFLSTRTRAANLPLNASIFGQFLALLLSIFGYLFPDAAATTWPSLISLFAFFTYIVQLVGFFSLRVKLTRFEREFRSPFGVMGAMFSLLVFAIGIIASIVESYYSILVAVIYMGIMSAYYHFWARHSQTFSAAEKLVMLPVHAEIKNANGKPFAEFSFIFAKAFVRRVFVFKASVVRSSIGFHHVCYHP
jgi:ethanolamine permease